MNDIIKDVHLITDEKAAAAYLHPVRLRILQFLAGRAMTISQVASVLGVHPANLTHHFRKLSDAGLISMVLERDTGRVVEKYYRSIARTFEIHNETVPVRGAAQRAMRMLIADMESALPFVEDNREKLLCLLGNGPVSDRNFLEFRSRLEDLMKAFLKEARSSEHEQQKHTYYSLNLSLYPRPSDATLPDNEEKDKRSKTS